MILERAIAGRCPASAALRLCIGPPADKAAAGDQDHPTLLAAIRHALKRPTEIFGG